MAAPYSQTASYRKNQRKKLKMKQKQMKLAEVKVRYPLPDNCPYDLDYKPNFMDKKAKAEDKGFIIVRNMKGDDDEDKNVMKPISSPSQPLQH